MNLDHFFTLYNYNVYTQACDLFVYTHSTDIMNFFKIKTESIALLGRWTTSSKDNVGYLHCV